MTDFRSVRVAALQATPVVLDAEACVEKAERLLGEAADQGAQVAVLPECFVPLYPSNAWARSAAGFGGWDELWGRQLMTAMDGSRRCGISLSSRAPLSCPRPSTSRRRRSLRISRCRCLRARTYSDAAVRR